MARIKPFRGVRPPKNLVEQVESRPYDVLDSEEARAEAGDNPMSLYHIIKPEINFEPGTSEYDPKVYQEAARQFQLFQEKGWLVQDQKEQYYTYAQTVKNKMMRQWYSMNLNLGNILTALIAKKYGWNVGDYIMGDNEVNEMIRTNRTTDFGLGSELDYMPQLMRIVSTQDPVEKEREIDAFKWAWLDDATFFDPFTIEAVFAYLIKLDMLERWAILDVEEGKKTFRSLIENLRKSAQVPEEFQHKDLFKRKT